MRTLAILPVKRFALAKTRLREQLAPPQLRSLAEAMVGDVLDALLATAALDGVVVVTNEPTVTAIAGSCGAIVLPDRTETPNSRSGLASLTTKATQITAVTMVAPLPSNSGEYNPAVKIRDGTNQHRYCSE